MCHGNYINSINFSLRVHHISIEEIVEAKGDVRILAEKTTGAKLQVIIICPNMLEHISLHPQDSLGLVKLIQQDRILALLLGVTEEQISDVHQKAFSNFSQWKRFTLGAEQDEDFTFINSFMTTALSMLTKTLNQQYTSSSQEKSQFSVMPKKVRQGQNGVLISMAQPLEKDDYVKVSIEKNNELLEVTNMKKRNPYTLKINVPEMFLDISAIVNIVVEKNGSIIGSRPIKCESRLREMEQILRTANDPVSFMCQVQYLNFNFSK